MVPPTPTEVAREAEERQQLDQELEAERLRFFGPPRHGPDPAPAPPIVFFDLEDDDDDDEPNPPRNEAANQERAVIAAAIGPDGQRRVTTSLVVQRGIQIASTDAGPHTSTASSFRSWSPPPRARQLSDYTRAVDLEPCEDE